MSKYINTSQAVDIGYLSDWYQNSIMNNIAPIWTDEHIEELTNDFLVIPLESVENHGIEFIDEVNIGDICFYPITSKNNSLALVQIEEILDTERGIAVVKFIKVFNDNTGNNYFTYLLEAGKTMNVSVKYLQNITPKIK